MERPTTWQTDPRWPEHIVKLCEAIALDGVNSYPMLADALEELGLSECAKDVRWYGEKSKYIGIGMVRSTPPRAIGVLVGMILGDGYCPSNDWMDMVGREIERYLISQSLGGIDDDCSGETDSRGLAQHRIRSLPQGRLSDAR